MASNEQRSLGEIAQRLFSDALHNIIHDILLDQHHAHKLMVSNLNTQTRLPHCERCGQPCLLDPPLAPKVRGATGDPPRDTQYCEKKPWARRPGHDIYDNPFPKADATGRPPSKKEREQAKANAKRDGDGTPDDGNSQANGTGPPSPSENGEAGGGETNKKLEKGEKKASKIDEKLKKGEYVPWHTCPSCKRSLLITRFAKHLEQCMGLSGRAASRNALARMNGSTSGSRAGTPNPSQDGGRAGDGEDDEDEDVKGPGGVRKKVLKKGFKNKIRKDKSLAPGANGKLPRGLTSKRPPGSGSHHARGSPAPSSAAGEGKRDREELLDDDAEDDEHVHTKKRQKLARVGSIASINSQSTAMERGESNDGSFVDDGSIIED